MKAVILNSLPAENKLNSIIRPFINQQLSKLGYEIKLFNLGERNIAPCTGCDYCFEKKVGVCCKQDGMQDIYPKLANSELYIFITQINFGGFSSDLKKVIDRFMPLFLPTYTIHKCELHHPRRYNNPQKLFFLGVLKDNFEEQKATFNLAANRLEKAFFVSRAASVVAEETADDSLIKQRIKEGFIERGGKVND